MLFWKEIFLTTDQKKLQEKEEILLQNHILYRTKKQSREKRQSINLTGREAFLYRVGSIPLTTYYLYVQKKMWSGQQN